MDAVRKIFTRWREIGVELNAIDERIGDRFRRAELGEISYSDCDSGNFDDRERVHALASELSGLLLQLDELFSPALPVIEEALGDAHAYRTDSGEAPEEALEDYEREACARYQKLADLLGMEIE